jgi:biopolymer transport protein ExbB
MELFEQGGIVMWILLAVSLFGFIIFVERTLYLHKSQIRTNEFLSGIQNLLGRGRLIEALTVCEETPGPVGSVVKAGLLRADEGEERMRGAMQEAALVEIPILERRIGTLAAITQIAPIIGIIGTLIGIHDGFFRFFGGEAVAFPRLTDLAGGAAMALHTTILGLVIAVMAHVAHHFLSGRVRVLLHDMEYAGTRILQLVAHDLAQSGERAAPDAVVEAGLSASKLDGTNTRGEAN